jgi:receptor expression-enhancing protein 5/6
MDKVKETLKLNELEKNKTLKNFADKIGISVPNLVLGTVAVLATIIILNYGANIVTTLVGFLYPAYMSFKAVETTLRKAEAINAGQGAASQPNPERLAGDEAVRLDMRHWLTYWVVYSFYTCIDPLLLYALSFIGIFYYVMKVLFFIFLFHPKYKGATLIYDKVLKNLLKKYEEHIDKQINTLGKVVDEKAKPMMKDVKAYAVNKALN